MATYQGGNTAADRNSYTSGMMRWRETAREEAMATAALNPERDQVSRYVQALQGGFWDSRRRARYKSSFFDNRLNNARQSDLAQLTDAKPTIDISSKVEAYKSDAEIVQKVIAAEWLKNDMDMSLITAADIAMLQGTSFWKIGAAFPGTLQVLPCGPESVMPIQPGTHIQQSTAILYRTWKGLSYFRNKFPFGFASLANEAGVVEPTGNGQTSYNRPETMDEYTWNGLSPAMRRALGAKQASGFDRAPSPFRSLELQEYYVDDPTVNESPNNVLMRHPYLSLDAHNWWYWVKPGERLYPRKRMVVFGGRQLLYDGPAPSWHGLYPFACLRLNPVPWEFWGLSTYRDLLPLNQGLNEIGAGIIDMVRRALNPTAVSKASAVAPATWNEFYPDMPGGKLYMMPMGNPATDLRYLDPPNIPAWVMGFHQYLAAEFDRLSGSVDAGTLAKKKQLPAGDTLDQMKDMQNSGARLRGRLIEVFLRDAGMQAMSHVFQHFALSTRMRMLGEDGISVNDFDFNGANMIPDGVPREDFWKNFAMTILPGSLHGGARDRTKQMALQLATHGLLPIEFLYKTLDLPDPEGIFAQLQKEKQAGVQPQGRGGRPSAAKKGQ